MIKKFTDRIEYYNKTRKLHRVDGPAIECYDGDKFWYINGKLHRIDGPAIEWANGDKEWWVNGRFLNYTNSLINYNEPI